MQPLTIKELTDAVGAGITPRMVRHYHQLGLLPQPKRSDGNYRLYTDQDVKRLKRIVAFKQQGFQLSHIRKLLEADDTETSQTLISQLQQQYSAVMQQMIRLRQTATALEGLLGRDRQCQAIQADAIAQLKLLEVETQSNLDQLEQLWNGLDAAVDAHPETFTESLQQLLPDLSDRSEIEVDLLSKLVLACGDVSLIPFVKLNHGAIAASRTALKAGCQIVTDVAAIASLLDHTRLAHLGCTVKALIENPHISSAPEAEQAFWREQALQENIKQISTGSIVVIGYAPSILLAVCDAVQNHQIQPALVIGMPIGFSHAPAAKRQLMHLEIPSITIAGTLGGGLLAATALNALVESLIEKPDCHCFLKSR
ncbi:MULTISPECIES: precorrin-8X methylmutase [Leptolyngbya]|uniref:precorrin-8X methylmutase n=1 Tax=Leptolyngbya TaxID=47251 RepID=UPI001687D790|nr:precorrin-8X methylmutase [Leptolyngbya sp. FACHB-1624]MBD1854811.1 precorrin-8X methylmutase [Leptolyngbya sp. FACHB-1624]